MNSTESLDENIKDATLVKGIKSSWVISPDSTFRTTVDLGSFIIIMIISIYIPFIFAFDVDTSNYRFEFFEMGIDIWFLTEISLNFNTAFSYKGYLV